MKDFLDFVENVPDSVWEIVVIGGSGLTAIGILCGLAQQFEQRPPVAQALALLGT